MSGRTRGAGSPQGGRLLREAACSKWAGKVTAETLSRFGHQGFTLCCTTSQGVPWSRWTPKAWVCTAGVCTIPLAETCVSSTRDPSAEILSQHSSALTATTVRGLRDFTYVCQALGIWTDECASGTWGGNVSAPGFLGGVPFSTKHNLIPSNHHNITTTLRIPRVFHACVCVCAHMPSGKGPSTRAGACLNGFHQMVSQGRGAKTGQRCASFGTCPAVIVPIVPL